LLPECSNRYFGKPVKFVVKVNAAKLVKLGNEKAVTIAAINCSMFQRSH
jgi:hypothetical protein